MFHHMPIGSSESGAAAQDLVKLLGGGKADQLPALVKHLLVPFSETGNCPIQYWDSTIEVTTVGYVLTIF